MYLQQTGTSAVIVDSSTGQPLSDTTGNLQAHPAYATGLFTVVASLPNPWYALSFSSPIEVPQQVVPPAITKGIQGTTGFPVQELKDAGRTLITFYATALNAPASGSEAVVTLNRFKQGEGVTSGTSFVLTSGKYFRITSIMFATRGHSTATAQTTTFSLRASSSGAVTTSSTAVFQARCATPATSNSWDRFNLSLPDGIEVVGDGSVQIGVSAVSTYTTNAPTGDIMIIGFEY